MYFEGSFDYVKAKYISHVLVKLIGGSGVQVNR